jgi:hypothetical protein
MAESFEDQDLSGAVFWDVDLSGARFRGVNLIDATISHSWLRNVDIDAVIEKITINGVDVTAYVNERDAWYPLRSMLSPPEPDGMRTSWRALEDAWATTIARAQQLPEAKLHESVDGEWSFVQTLRHIVFAIDKWFTVPVLGEKSFHPIGLPNSGSDGLEWPGRDRDAQPSLAEALEVRADRANRVHDYLETATTSDLTTVVDILENGENPIHQCILVVFEETFEHNRYAIRDLTILETAG